MLILLVANLTVTSVMFGVIWVIQLVHYPLFEGLDFNSFTKWHEFHARYISFIVAPMMVGELGLSLWYLLAQREWVSGLLFALTVGIWASTFLLSVPLHNRLGQQNASFEESRVAIRKLVLSNWPRTLIYSLKFLGLIAAFLATVSHLTAS